MPLQIPTPPTTVNDTVRSTLQNVAEGNQSSIEALHQLPADQLTLTLPHQIFTIGRDQLAEGATLNTATAVGWRYLVSARGQIIASAETVTSPDNEQEVFFPTHRGPLRRGHSCKQYGSSRLLDGASFKFRFIARNSAILVVKHTVSVDHDQ